MYMYCAIASVFQIKYFIYFLSSLLYDVIIGAYGFLKKSHQGLGCTSSMHSH